MTDMKELYKPFKQKYSLPDFDLLDEAFELSDIEEKNFVLRKIRGKMIEKAEVVLDMFNEIIHPDSGFSGYMESNLFEDSDRDEILKIYKRLMYFKRLSTELCFDDSDEKNAKFISQFMKEWSELKKKILPFVVRLKESWQNELSKKQVVGYLG
jgi:hypothetical protein